MTEQHILHAQPELALMIIGGRWKMPILWRLALRPVWRYGELKKDLSPISHKMLSQQLKELGESGLVERKLYPVVPPRVEYSLTDKGKLALPAIRALCHFYSDFLEHEDKQPPACIEPDLLLPTKQQKRKVTQP